MRERGLNNLDDPLPSVSLSTAVLTIDAGMSQTVAIIAAGALAGAVMRVRVQVTGDALLSLLQDGNGLRASGGATYTLDLGGNTSTVLTIRDDGDKSLADNQTKTATLTIVDAGGADIGDQDTLTVTVRGSTVVPPLLVVGRLLLSLFMMAAGARLYRRRQRQVGLSFCDVFLRCPFAAFPRLRSPTHLMDSADWVRLALRASSTVPPRWSARPLSGPGRLTEIGCDVAAPAPRADPGAREAVR